MVARETGHNIRCQLSSCLADVTTAQYCYIFWHKRGDQGAGKTAPRMFMGNVWLQLIFKSLWKPSSALLWKLADRQLTQRLLDEIH